MFHKHYPRIDALKLEKEIKVKLFRGNTSYHSSGQTVEEECVLRNELDVDELLPYHGLEFIEKAYLAVLKRLPARIEADSHLKVLRSGKANKIDIIAALRYSAEGKSKDVRVRGLWWPSTIRRFYRVPVLGYILNIIIALLRIPRTIENYRRLEFYFTENIELAFTRVREMQEDIQNLYKSVHEQSRHLLSQIESLEQKLEHSVECVRKECDHCRESFWEEIKKQEAASNRLHDELRELRNTLTEFELTQDRLLRDTSQNLLELGKRIDDIKLNNQQLRRELTLGDLRFRRDFQTRSAVRDSDSLVPPSLYLHLEDRFRGTREEVKRRLSVYLPLVRKKSRGLFIDIGCGRGEWLELLKGEGINAIGVDINQAMLSLCRELGLSVIEKDAVEYLRCLDDDCAEMITCFHVIEHLSFAQLVNLLDETLRVLCPGGEVIFETPNPENLLVGSSYFYFDPTHRNPIPSETMVFLLESRGFHHIELLKLHPWDEAKFQDDSDMASRLNDLLYGPMDYAVIGRKV
ncbi:MAG: hypothetical protein C4334_15290 [Pyrinomonas sp.]|uniref:class I SAM-dependent methyltransferase n=1 Tax=Pyrinomonas sp. TaxID=2080306 RepID=UPI003320B32F